VLDIVTEFVIGIVIAIGMEQTRRFQSAPFTTTNNRPNPSQRMSISIMISITISSTMEHSYKLQFCDSVLGRSSRRFRPNT